MENFLGDDFRLMQQPNRDTTTPTPTSQQSGILYVVCYLNASRVAPFSLLLSQYLHHLEKVVLLDNDKTDNNIP